MAVVGGYDIAAITTSVGDWVYFGVIILIFLAIGVGLIVWAYIMSRYNIKFRIRNLIKGRTQIHDVKVRRVKDRDGNAYLKIWGIWREKIQLPPEDAVDVDKKGKPVLEAYRTETGEYIYITDTPKVRVVPKEITKIKDEAKRQEAMDAWEEKYEVEYAFHPLTSQQRATVISQTQKAQQRKSNGWKQNLPTMVAIGALVIIIVSLFIFWGDIAKPALNMQGAINAYAEIQNKQLQILEQINNRVQTLEESNKGTGDKPPPN